MRTPSWTEEHSRAVSAAAPSVEAASSDELHRIWQTVQTRQSAGVAPRRRRARLAIGAAAVAATLAVGGVATAAVLSAHTGRFPSDAEDLRLGGPGERLDPAAPGYGAVIDEETQDVPFPSTWARTISRVDLVEDGLRDDPGTGSGTGSVSTGAMRLWTAQAAICAWSNEWAAATISGDVTVRGRAVAMLDQASDWTAVTDVDPVQTIQHESGAETPPDNTPAGYLPLLQAAAHGDDVDAVGAVLATWVYCPPGLMTDLPQALPGA